MPTARDTPEYSIYPEGLTFPYRDRRFSCGELLYSALRIPREDIGGRLRRFAHNFAYVVDPSAELMLFCAMVIGYISPDRTADSVRMERALIEETVSLPGPPWTVFGWR